MSHLILPAITDLSGSHKWLVRVSYVDRFRDLPRSFFVTPRTLFVTTGASEADGELIAQLFSSVGLVENVPEYQQVGVISSV